MGNRTLPLLQAAGPCPDGRHKHLYQIPSHLPPCWQCKRRDVTLTHGGALPASVDCPRDAVQVRRVTDYERGREDARSNGLCGRGGF